MSILAMDASSLRLDDVNWTICRVWLPQGGLNMSPFKLVMAFAAMTSLLTMLAIQRIPADEPIVMKPTEVVESVVAKKTDPIRTIAMTPEPKPVIVERVAPPEAPTRIPPVIVVQEDPPPVAVKRQRRSGGDVCQRHGMRKVETRGGKSWRCRK